MPQRTAADVKAEIKDIRTKYEEVIAKADPADDAELREMDTKLEGLFTEYAERQVAEKRADSNRQALAQMFNPDSKAAQPTTDGAPKVSTSELVTIAESVLADPQFKSWYDNLTVGGGPINERVGIKSPTVHLTKSLITGLSSTSGGALVVNDRTNIIVPGVRDALRASDLLTRMTTQSDTVEYVRVGTETSNAAPVLEATATNDGAKPESTATLAVVTAIVENIAHYINLTRRALADAGQLRTYIDDFLMWGLRDALNDEIVNGSGTTPHLQGIDDLSGTQAQSFSSNILETTRKARTLVDTVGRAVPTAYLLNPTDWETIDLLQDNENRYFFGGPSQMGTPVLWGLPVVTDVAVTQGLGFVGDWRMGIIFDREQANILMTDSHSDFFIRNIVTLLAEMRVTLAWLRPAAFVEMDLTA